MKVTTHSTGILNTFCTCTFVLVLGLSQQLFAADYLKSAAYEAQKESADNVKIFVKDGDASLYGPYYLNRKILTEVEFFKRTLESGMKEAQHNEITMTLDIVAFNMIVNYLFIGEGYGKFAPESAFKFIQAADYLQDDVVRRMALDNLLRCPQEFASVEALAAAFAHMNLGKAFSAEDREQVAKYIRGIVRKAASAGVTRKDIRSALTPKGIDLMVDAKTFIDEVVRSLEPVGAKDKRSGWEDRVSEGIAGKLVNAAQVIDEKVDSTKTNRSVTVSYAEMGLTSTDMTKLTFSTRFGSIVWAVATGKKYDRSGAHVDVYTNVSKERLQTDFDLAVNLGVLERIRADFVRRGFKFETHAQGVARIAW
jgi:hypothetical protein